jgi:group I intron endonuclease
MNKIIGVYRIINTVTGDTYIGSSIDIHKRWVAHRSPSTWILHSKNKMYQDFQDIGLNKFTFEIIYQCCRPILRKMEQLAMELYKPSYNWMWSYGRNVTRYKNHKKVYFKSYNNRKCIYNGKPYTFHALTCKLSRQGVEHPTLEAKKYLLVQSLIQYEN